MLSDEQINPTGADMAEWLLNDQGCGCHPDYPNKCNICIIVAMLRAHDDAVRLREDVSKWKRAWIGRADEASEWRDALHRSPYDISPCMECGKPVVCIPDGMPMCEPCGAALRPAGQGAGEEPTDAD